MPFSSSPSLYWSTKLPMRGRINEADTCVRAASLVDACDLKESARLDTPVWYCVASCRTVIKKVSGIQSLAEILYPRQRHASLSIGNEGAMMSASYFQVVSQLQHHRKQPRPISQAQSENSILLSLLLSVTIILLEVLIALSRTHSTIS
jgi:hypothetical protein